MAVEVKSTRMLDCFCACCKERGCHCLDYHPDEWCTCEDCDNHITLNLTKPVRDILGT